MIMFIIPNLIWALWDRWLYSQRPVTLPQVKSELELRDKGEHKRHSVRLLAQLNPAMLKMLIWRLVGALAPGPSLHAKEKISP